MKRRGFIAGLGSAAALPVVARAQQPALPLVGWLGIGSPDEARETLTALKQGMKQGLAESGFVEGRNFAFEYRSAENQYDLPALAADLVRRRVAVIVVVSTEPALAAKAATTIIPIVFSIGSDPVAFGLVASLNRPGANVTGSTILGTEMVPKPCSAFLRSREIG
jgi:putative ABC transport system substrate-binding protein